MSITTPTTKEVSDNIVAQLEAALNQSLPPLPRSFTRVLAKSIAGVFMLLYKYAGFMFLQMFVRTAVNQDTEINGVIVNPLTEIGRLVGVGNPVAATNAQMTVEVTVESQSGFLPANSQLVGPGNGVTYVTLASVALDAPTKTVEIKAVSDQFGGGGAGVAGNLDPGSVVSFAGTLSNVARSAVVVAQTVTGADAESTDVYRQRVLDRFQKRPQGGAYSDYELWGEEAAGILNVYPYTSDCPGQVDLYVEATVASSGSADGIPTNAQLLAVLAAVEGDQLGRATRRPAGALVNALPIRRLAFTVTVTALDVADSAAVLNDIEDAVRGYFLSREPYIPGLSVPPRLDRITRAGVDAVIENIVSAAGGVFGGSIITYNTIQTDAYALGIGEKATLGALINA